MPIAVARPAPNIPRAYLYHLIKSNEILGSVLLTWHNIQYYQDLMADMRAAIEAGTFEAFEQEFHRQQALGDVPPIED